MHYVIYAPDKPDSKDRRAATRPRHLEYWKNSPLKVLLAGPMIDEDTGDMKGSMLLIDAEDIETVREHAFQDPYWTEGVFGSIDVTAIRLPLGTLAGKL
jgi:uncharacterized protein YciI